MTTPLTLTPQDAAAILAAVDGTLAEGSMAVAALREYVAANPLVPEWPNGTHARILTNIPSMRGKWMDALRVGSVWCATSTELTTHPADEEVISVCPLRILGDDEVAVKRIDNSAPEWWLVVAEWCYSQTRVRLGLLCRAYAAALEAAEVAR